MSELIRRFMRWCGFVPVSEYEGQRDARLIAEAQLTTERQQHGITRDELRKSEMFIADKLDALMLLEPVYRYASLQSSIDYLRDDTARQIAHEIIEGKRRDVVLQVMIPAVFDWWRHTRDLRAIDFAIEYIGKATAHFITRELRFGLTGSRADESSSGRRSLA